MSSLPKLPVVSAIVIADTYDAALRRCLQSLSWCQEIIIVDHDSQRINAQVCKLHAQVRVLTLPDLSDFAEARNKGAGYASSEIIFQVDSDEWINWSESDRHQLLDLVTQENVAAVSFKRHDIFFGKTLKWGELSQQWHARLYRKSQATFERPVHERLVATGKIMKSQQILFHEPHHSISDFLASVARYAEREATSSATRNKRFQPLDLITFPVGKALVSYLLRQGWRDGWHGIAYIVVMSWHSWLVRGFWYEKT